MAHWEWVGTRETGSYVNGAAGAEERPTHAEACPYEGGSYEDCIGCQVYCEDLTINEASAILLAQLGGW